MNEQIHNNVQELRKISKITQEEFAQKIGVSRQTVVAIEKGNYVPSLLLAIKISKFFNLEVEKVFTYSYER